MPAILLTTINAAYYHSSLALRYLKANLGDLESSCEILEFDSTVAVEEMADAIVRINPDILGLSIAIWNVAMMEKLTMLLKRELADCLIVLGGPEVSHFPIRANLFFDVLIQGEGEEAFRELCNKWKAGSKSGLDNVIIETKPADLSNIVIPAHLYGAEDIRNRIIYLESTRGCPYHCDFCLSSADGQELRFFSDEVILAALEALWANGARRFKFIDRSLNAADERCRLLIEWFLSRSEPWHVHFEFVPLDIKESLKDLLKLVPPHSLQLEIGVQSLNPDVCQDISRPFDGNQLADVLEFLIHETHIDLHLDLIAGLPGETVSSFGESLDALVEMGGKKIQCGILKSLSGTALSRPSEHWKMVYSPHAPYEVICTEAVPREDMQRLKRFSRYWELLYNRRLFTETLAILFSGAGPFDSFMAFSDYIYKQTGETGDFDQTRLAALLLDYLCTVKKLSQNEVKSALRKDYALSRNSKVPRFLKDFGR